MNRVKSTLWAAAALMAATAPAFAHHAFSAEFDSNKLITLTGTCTKVEWTNPHAHFHLSVKGKDGAEANWDFELASPNGLMRKGWTRSSLKAGDTVTAQGYLSKDGSNIANARSVTLSDGRQLFAGSSYDEPNQ
jgi:hypothetical protein